MPITQINKIPDVEFISGDTVSFECNVVDVDNSGRESVANVSDCTLTFKMSYYGQEEVNIFEKKFSLEEDEERGSFFKIILNCEETSNFYGSYTHQWILEDAFNNKYVRAMGRIDVKRGIPNATS